VKIAVTEQQIASALKQQELGVAVEEDLPQAGDLGRYPLQLEEEIFGPGAVRAAAAEAV
jgi:hypothetical protein